MYEDLRERYQSLVDKNPYVSGIGIEILEISKGCVVTRVKKRRELENVYGDFHGGCLYTIADNMAGIAASMYGYYVTTLNGSIQYLKAGRNTEYIFCRAEVIKPGKTITVVHVELTDDKETLINTAEFTYFNLRKHEDDSLQCITEVGRKTGGEA